MKKHTKNIQAWKSVSDVWGSLRPPLRPSVGEIRIYEKFLKRILPKISSRRALLFGATPELRDLLAKYNFQVTLIDINPAMVNATTKLLKRKNHQEKIIIGDWLKTPLALYKYDVIMGDHIMGNVKFRRWDQFLRRIIGLLSSNGYYITNVQLKFPVKKIISFEKLIDSYLKYPKKFDNIEYQWQMLYQMMYGDKRFCGYPDYLILWPAIPQIQKFLEKSKIFMDNHGIAKLASNIYVKEFKYSSPPRQVFEKIFKKRFKIIDSDISRKHLVYQSYRIYLAKPLR
ncbi:MAG: class I SAM-dependent methyltransferase [Patescibacteria group bacterium]|nr:class I SAM-dependent methyltransferase [Patescibacteria group bacterium]MDD5121016.1 class I SAM-dependent methyltransferase [Patescibacteria group bacterium]MDD5221623.1 class I SAM-dependent methyltransferase [Patescibacteria group bacterium]MDD5396065.1 class I SAM-dependent methyltransferase [Patescibacteria group bacterium]